MRNHRTAALLFAFGLLVTGAAAYLLLPSLVRRLDRFLTAQTPAQQLAGAQAAYDRAERPGRRGERFYELTAYLDEQGQGLLTEQEVVNRLGPPDGQQHAGSRRMVVYYYDRFGRNDWYAGAMFNNGTLVHFGYNATSELPASTIEPYVAPPPTTGPATAPATPPATNDVTPS